MIYEQELLGKAIFNWRTERKMTGPDLASAAGISKSALSKIERGIGNPCLITLVKLARALKIQFQIQ